MGNVDNNKKGILGTVSGYYGCVEAQGRGSLHCHLLDPLSSKERLKSKLEIAKNQSVEEELLNPRKFNKDEFLKSVLPLSVKRLAKPYLPQNKFISESSLVFSRNHSFIHDRKPPNICIPWKLMFSADTHQLQIDIKENERRRIYCGNELVLVVIRDACKQNQLVGFLDDSIVNVIAS